MRESCAEKGECAKLFQELEICNQRVASKSKTEETCVQELFDFLECRDKCVSSLECEGWCRDPYSSFIVNLSIYLSNNSLLPTHN